MAKWWSVLFALTMAFCAGCFVVAPMMGWWLPEGHSTHSWSVDRLFYFILAITTFFFILTEALLCIFMWKYAAGQPKADPSVPPPEPGLAAKLFRPVTNLLNDQHKVEMAWTIVPALLLLYIAFAQVSAWADVKYQSRMPLAEWAATKKAEKMPVPDGYTTPLQLDVSARQFEWRVRYPSPQRFEDWMKNKDDDGQVAKDYKAFAREALERRGQFDDLKDIPNEVHVIKGQPVVIHLSTRDVIHSFNLPHMRVKQDALPGKVIPLWFTPTQHNCRYSDKLGKFEDGFNPNTGNSGDNHYIWDLACAELCGWGHYRMIGRLYVHKDAADFLTWLKMAEAQSHAHK